MGGNSYQTNARAVGNAKLDGLTTDLHFTNNEYLFTLTIYFIAYVSIRLAIATRSEY